MLVADGQAPTVEEAAAAANVSRTTAYRYFASQRALLVAAYPAIDATSLLPPDAPADDPARRLGMVVDVITRMVVENEAQQRTMLRLSLKPTPTPRSERSSSCGKAARSAGSTTPSHRCGAVFRRAP